MSAEQLTAFWAAVEDDASLQEKLSASTDGEIDTPIEAAAVVAIAKDAGFTITAGDLLRGDAEAILELNDEELEKVAGGRGNSPTTKEDWKLLIKSHLMCSIKGIKTRDCPSPFVD